MTADTFEPDPGLDRAMAWTRLLADEIGPRRPTGAGEREAAERMQGNLSRAGVPAELERFEGYASFFQPYAAILGAATLPALIPRRARMLRTLIAAGAALGLVTEGGFTHTPLSRALSRRPSVNLLATLEPTAQPRRTVCLVGHFDTSRSGLLFHPRAVRHLTRWISTQSVAVLVGSAEPLLTRSRVGRGLLVGARAIVAVGLVLLIGCEESGLLGMQSFLRTRDTTDWLFVNFDSVGGPATLRFLRREGIFKKWDADAGLTGIAEEIADRRPELGLR